MKKLEPFQILVLCQIPIFIFMLNLNASRAQSQAMKELTETEKQHCADDYCWLPEDAKSKKSTATIQLCDKHCESLMKSLTRTEIGICQKYCNLPSHEKSSQAKDVINLCRYQCGNACVIDASSCD